MCVCVCGGGGEGVGVRVGGLLGGWVHARVHVRTFIHQRERVHVAA
jgi:hypothetical protein